MTWKGSRRFHHTASSPLKPELILGSEDTRQLILMGLCPMRKRMEEARERKRAKYQDVVQDCRRINWKTRCIPVHSAGPMERCASREHAEEEPSRARQQREHLTEKG